MNCPKCGHEMPDEYGCSCVCECCGNLCVDECSHSPLSGVGASEVMEYWKRDEKGIDPSLHIVSTTQKDGRLRITVHIDVLKFDVALQYNNLGKSVGIKWERRD